MQTRVLAFLLSLCACALSACAAKSIAPDDSVNRALKICGLGLEAKSADAYKIAVGSASGSKELSLGSEASYAIDTQIGVLMKQADLTSDASIRAVAEEMKATRECVVTQLSMLDTPTRADLLEQCRQDVQRKLSPPGYRSFGQVRSWNQADGVLSRGDIVEMTGYFDTGGTSSFDLLATCNIRNGRFEEAVVRVRQS